MPEESLKLFRRTLKNMYNTLIWLLFELFCFPQDPSVFLFNEKYFFAPSYSSSPKPYLRHPIQSLYVYSTRNLCRYVPGQQGPDRISGSAEEDSETLN